MTITLIGIFIFIIILFITISSKIKDELKTTFDKELYYKLYNIMLSTLTEQQVFNLVRQDQHEVKFELPNSDRMKVHFIKWKTIEDEFTIFDHNNDIIFTSTRDYMGGYKYTSMLSDNDLKILFKII